MNSLEEPEPVKEKESCGICGDLLDSKFVYRLKCNHEFHYECIQKSLMTIKSNANRCPYCRGSFEILEPVNGIKNLKLGIHYKDPNNIPEYTNTKCDYLMTRGKNKGNACGNNCQIGFFKCGLHNKHKQATAYVTAYVTDKDIKDNTTITTNSES